MKFVTPYQKNKMAKDDAILREWESALKAEPNASRGMLTRYLMEKYGFNSPSAIWTARKRAEARRDGGQ